MDEKILVAIVYFLLSAAITAYQPQYANIWYGLAIPVVTYYFISKKVENTLKPKGLFETTLSLIVFLLVAFLVVVVFTYIFVHFLLPVIQ